jgi:hypothetical protein
VFGPGVNLGGRLETMAKQLRASIPVDDATAQCVSRLMSPGAARLRRPAKTRPVRMDEPLWASELLLGTKPTEHISAQQIEMFKRAEEIVAGSWPSDLEILLSFRARDRVREIAISYL